MREYAHVDTPSGRVCAAAAAAAPETLRCARRGFPRAYSASAAIASLTPLSAPAPAPPRRRARALHHHQLRPVGTHATWRQRAHAVRGHPARAPAGRAHLTQRATAAAARRRPPAPGGPPAPARPGPRAPSLQQGKHTHTHARTHTHSVRGAQARDAEHAPPPPPRAHASWSSSPPVSNTARAAESITDYHRSPPPTGDTCFTAGANRFSLCGAVHCCPQDRGCGHVPNALRASAYA